MNGNIPLPSREAAVLAAVNAIQALPPDAREIKTSVWQFVPDVGGGWGWTVQYASTIGNYRNELGSDERPRAQERTLALMRVEADQSGRVHASTVAT